MINKIIEVQNKYDPKLNSYENSEVHFTSIKERLKDTYWLLRYMTKIF